MWQTPTIKEDDGIPHNAMSHTQEQGGLGGCCWGSSLDNGLFGQ